MNKFRLTISFLILKGSIGFAQSPSKLFPSDTLSIFSGGNMSIWGDFYNTSNSASGGSLVINPNGHLTMYGDTFQNSNATKIGGTGNFEMKRPRPSPYATSTKQLLLTGGSAVSFPVITVNTTSYIELKDADLRIRDSLKFISGHILLNRNDLIIGNGTPGVITGYSENNFIVTNGNTRDTNKGYLIREQISSTNTIFPIGQAIGDYTPASITNNGTTDDYKVRVFDTVYEDGYNLIAPIPLTANERSVKRTWDIREGTNGGSNINLTLQYNTVSESSDFNTNRSKAFISHYTGIYPNNGGDTLSNWKWDMFKFSSTSTPSSPGTLTSGSSISGAAMKTRNGISSFSPFSITAWAPGAIPLPVNIISFSAQWMNNTSAIIKWQMAQPESLKSIVLERSFNGNAFTPFQTFKTNNTLSAFQTIDTGVYYQANSGVFYRLKMIEENGTISYTHKLFLNKNSSADIEQIAIFPNPGNELLYIRTQHTDLSFPLTIELINEFGQIVYSKTLQETNTFILNETIDIKRLTSGIYQLKIEGSNNRLIKKIAINR